MKTLALLSSMPFESDHILSCMKNVRKTKIASAVVHKGKFSGQDIILAATGIGKVNAAILSTAVMEHFPVQKIILFGVGGAYPGAELNVGDVAAASKEIYGDEGVIDSEGWHSLRKIGIPLVESGRKKFFNEYPVSPLPLPSLTAGGIGGGSEISFKIKAGNFVTVSSSTGTMKRAKELEKRFNAICENMEGAAVAHLCTLYKIPLIEIRGISNIVGVRDRRKWNLKLASRNCQLIVLETLET
jgi:futalosine hydrolase